METIVYCCVTVATISIVMALLENAKRHTVNLVGKDLSAIKVRKVNQY